MWENAVAIKKLQSEIFNQLNIKKVKSIKIILKKKTNKKKGKVGKKNKSFWKKEKREIWKKKKLKNKKECTVDYYCNP